MFSNPVEAEDAFNARADQSDLLLAAVPYSSIVDSTIVIKESDLKDAYDKKKEQFRQYVETRNIKYIDVQVTASPEDKADIQKEVEEYTAQLAENPSDYANFVVQPVLPSSMLTCSTQTRRCLPTLLPVWIL